MNIYIFKIDDVIDLFPEYNGFTPSEWNDLNELPKEVIDLMKGAKKNDRVFNPYNFMLCFNLEDVDTSNENNIIFIPDPKFNL